MTQVSQSDYRTAQKGNAKVRQEFIDAIDLGEDKKLIKSIKYVSTNFEEEIPLLGESVLTVMALQPTLDIIILTGGKVGALEIYPTAYEYVYTDFMNSLCHHELTHARKIVNHRIESTAGAIFTGLFRKSMEDYFEVLEEIPAYMSQLSSTAFFQPTTELRVETAKLIGELEDFVTIKSQKFDRDYRRDLSKILCPSPYDDAVRKRYGID
jgi:hypothetical protein